MDIKEEMLMEITSKLTQYGFDAEQMQKIRNAMVIGSYNYTVSKSEKSVFDTDNSEELIGLYKSQLTIEGKSKKTVKAYGDFLKRFAKDVSIPVKSVKTTDVTKWLCIQQETVTLRTCENYRSYLSAFYQWLNKQEIIAKNPMEKISPIKYKKKVRLPLDDIQIDSLRCGCKTLRQRAILELILSSGARVSEVCAMDRDDINFMDGQILIQEGKGNKQRVVYINDLCKSYLKKYLDSRKDDNPCLFLTKDKTRVNKNNVELEIKNLGVRSGVDNVFPHRLRRTFATNLFKKGMDIVTIQKLMGHADVNVTMEYITVCDKRVKSEYSKLN